MIKNIKSQSGILSVVLLTGIILALVGAAYIWAGPLLSKNVDMANIDSIIDFLNNLNSEILYAARTGGNRVLSANMEQASLIINPLGNQIIIEASSAVPMVNSVEEIPLNFYELSQKNEDININASKTHGASISGYDSSANYDEILINELQYNASLLKNSSSAEFDLLCLWKDELSIDDCATEYEVIQKEGVSHEIIYINESGSNAFFLGGLAENKGVFGSEPSGIISAKGFNIGNREHMTFYLTYRGLINDEDVDFKIIIECSNNCVISGEQKSVSITRKNVLRQQGKVYTTIGIEVI